MIKSERKYVYEIHLSLFLNTQGPFINYVQIYVLARQNRTSQISTLLNTYVCVSINSNIKRKVPHKYTPLYLWFTRAIKALFCVAKSLKKQFSGFCRNTKYICGRQANQLLRKCPLNIKKRGQSKRGGMWGSKN